MPAVSTASPAASPGATAIGPGRHIWITVPCRSLLFGLIASVWGAAESEVPAHLRPFLRVPVPSAETFVRAVTPAHPRLLLTNRRREEIRLLRERSPIAQRWHQAVRKHSDALATIRPIDYVPERPGERAQEIPMLHPGRALVDRILVLGLSAALDGDERAMERLRRELTHSLDTWPDWQYGLARAEIAAGFAFAYDWLHERWSPEERRRLREALRTLALEPFAREFAGWSRPSTRNAGIVRNNVNLVCNSGTSVAALAVIDEYPELAGDVLAKSFALLQVALPGFGEDGAWNEGVGYWKFGVRHLVQYLAALDTAAGTDFGLVSSDRFPGFARTGLFPLAMTSPAGRTFNFADDNAGTFNSAALLWLGSAFQLPLAIAHEERAATDSGQGHTGGSWSEEVPREIVQRLLYYRPKPSSAADAPPPLDWIYPDTGVATMRSSWTDPKATFIGVKGGSAQGNRHAHLDAGSVVIDALGERWLSEIGRGPTISRYYGNERYLFFPARTEAHNTLVINPGLSRGGNQSMSGRAILRPPRSSPDEAECQLDLTDLYPSATRAVRSVRLFGNRRRVSLTDEVELGNAGSVRWHGYTEAPIILPEPDGRGLTLEFPARGDGRSGKRMVVSLVSSDSSQRFVVEKAAPLPESEAIQPAPVKGFSRIAVESGAARLHRIAVEFVPVEARP